jgi:hypothetical protein
MPRATNAEIVGLPVRPFLYTIDQISVMTGISENQLLTSHCFFEQRSIGTPDIHLMKARNLNQGTDRPPDWRILDKEFVRWMKAKGFRYYEVGRFTS